MSRIRNKTHKGRHLSCLRGLSSISLCTQTLFSAIPPSFPTWSGLSLPPSACVRGCTGVSVMTMSQCSSLPISPVVITQTHMELSISPAPPHRKSPTHQGESERDRERTRASDHLLYTIQNTTRCANKQHEKTSFNQLCGNPTAGWKNATKPH